MFYFDDFQGKKVLKTDLLNSLNHFFTTRECPIRGSEANFKYSLGVNRLVSPIQTHSNNVQIVTDLDEYPNTDALVFDKKIIFVDFDQKQGG